MTSRLISSLRELLVSPKDKILKERVVGPVYYIPYNSFDASYTGETERSLKHGFLKHRRPSSTRKCHDIYIINNPEHHMVMDGVKILAVEQRWFKPGLERRSTSGWSGPP